MSNISLEAWKNVKQTQQKYDYFILSLSSALFAYLGSKFEPEKLSFSQNSIELLALASFAVSILFGILRLESEISVQSNDYRKAQAQERLDVVNKIINLPYRNIDLDTGSQISISEAQEKKQILQKFIAQSSDYAKELGDSYDLKFKVRNYSLLIGFALLVISKFVALYLASNA